METMSRIEKGKRKMESPRNSKLGIQNSKLGTANDEEIAIHTLIYGEQCKLNGVFINHYVSSDYRGG